ncbi:MAG: hypothetical protein WCM93_12740 [Bacteroidota bacterium]
MQNYNLPSVNHGNTFEGVDFILPTDSHYDLTNATAKIQLRNSPVNALVKEFVTPNTLLITLPHKITLPTQIIDFPAATYKYDLQITFADGRVKTYIGGEWIINPVITQ